ncbi:uncharacterized protein [Porites lutea]|uniref:uncharacterized protein isoform X2 n=1 Tax=Porites lutea TaxID=51062 RepID=UPI003CC54EAD
MCPWSVRRGKEMVKERFESVQGIGWHYHKLQIEALHFNENANKPQRLIKEGEKAGDGQWLVCYPKYKKGGAVAKEIKEACTYGYIMRLFEELLQLRRQFPSYSAAEREFRPMLQAIPRPLTSQRERQEKEAVIAQQKSRFDRIG